MTKIVQSLWSAPIRHFDDQNPNSRAIGGWFSELYFMSSWALSSLKLRSFYKKVDLVTDKDGYSLLIDALQLPYTHVETHLDSLHDFDKKLWAIGKIKTFNLQTEPFIHVDGDFYIWDRFPKSIEHGQLISQNYYDVEIDNCDTILDTIKSTFLYVPDAIQQFPTAKKLASVNMGITGGQDIDFIQAYAQNSWDFVTKNAIQLNNIDIKYFNNIFEEHLFYVTAYQHKKAINSLFDNSDDRILAAITKLNLVPRLSQYVHILGKVKQNLYVCEQMRMRLKYEFPEHYKKIENLLQIDSYKLDRNFKEMQRIYDFVAHADANDILEKPLQVRIDVELFQNEDNSLLINYPDATGTAVESSLQEWDIFLTYFIEPFTGKALITHILQATVAKIDKTIEITNKVIDFITHHLIYKRILVFAYT